MHPMPPLSRILFRLFLVCGLAGLYGMYVTSPALAGNTPSTNAGAAYQWPMGGVLLGPNGQLTALNLTSPLLTVGAGDTTATISYDGAWHFSPLVIPATNHLIAGDGNGAAADSGLTISNIALKGSGNVFTAMQTMPYTRLGPDDHGHYALLSANSLGLAGGTGGALGSILLDDSVSPQFTVSLPLSVPGLTVTGGAPGAGKVLTSDATGVATWQAASASLPSTTALIRGNGSGGAAAATAGTDYLSPSSNLNATNLASGTAPPARLGSGTPSSNNFLRGMGRGRGL